MAKRAAKTLDGKAELLRKIEELQKQVEQFTGSKIEPDKSEIQALKDIWNEVKMPGPRGNKYTIDIEGFLFEYQAGVEYIGEGLSISNIKLLNTNGLIFSIIQTFIEDCDSSLIEDSIQEEQSYKLLNDRSNFFHELLSEIEEKYPSYDPYKLFK